MSQPGGPKIISFRLTKGIINNLAFARKPNLLSKQYLVWADKKNNTLMGRWEFKRDGGKLVTVLTY